MTGGVRRHILPHLSGVPHLHVNRSLRVWVSTIMSLLHLRTKLLHCSVSRQFSGQLIINVLGSRPPRPELWALKQRWGVIRIHGVEIRLTINQHWFPPPSFSLYQAPDPPASKILKEFNDLTRVINYDLNLETAEFLELGLCDFGETLFSARH